MFINIKPRGGGKTTDAVNWVKEDLNKRAIVVRSNKEKEFIMDTHRVPSKNIFTFGCVETGHLSGTNISELYIDNVDMYLQALFDGRVRYCSLTDDDITLNRSVSNRKLDWDSYWGHSITPIYSTISNSDNKIKKLLVKMLNELKDIKLLLKNGQITENK